MEYKYRLLYVTNDEDWGVFEEWDYKPCPKETGFDGAHVKGVYVQGTLKLSIEGIINSNQDRTWYKVTESSLDDPPTVKILLNGHWKAYGYRNMEQIVANHFEQIL